MADSFVTPWTMARQASLSMGFAKQEYWGELHALLQGISQAGIEPTSPALAGEFFTTEPPGKLYIYIYIYR